MNPEQQLPIRVEHANRSELTRVLPPDRFMQAMLLHTRMHRYVRAALRWWWIPLLSLLLVGGPAVVYSTYSPALYRSQAVLWMGERLQLPEGRMYSEELSGYLGTQVELLKSGLIQDRAQARVRSQFPNTATNQLVFDLNARSSLRSSILEVSATGFLPDATRAYVDAVIQEYLRFKDEARKRTSSVALSTITDQIKEVERQIREKETALSDFEASNNISFLTESGVSAGSHLARLGALLSDLKTEHRLLQILTPEQLRDIARPSLVPSTGVPIPGQQAGQSLAPSAAAQEPAYYQALQQLQLLKAKRDDFAKVLRPSHSKMVKFNQEITGLSQLLDTLKSEGEQQAAAQMASRKKSLELQIENLQAQYHSWQSNSLAANTKLDYHHRIKQELDRCNALNNRLLSLVETVDLTKGFDQEALTPLAPASMAKATLSKYRIGAVGILFGLTFGAVLLVLLSVTDDRFTSATELSLHLPEEVVGQVPESSLAWRKNGHRQLRLEDPRGFIESFRNLRSHLLCMAELPPGPKVIVITSAVPQEGKTTVSANLGAALAAGGERVLIIDADLRRSSLHSVFNTTLTPGLQEVLTRQASLKDAIVATAQPNLFILPAGKSERVGSELFLQRSLDPMLTELEARFGYILVDTAPVLATDDAGSLGSHTHGAFVVVRAAHTSARMIREALERLYRRNVKVLGLIYNRADEFGNYYSRYANDYHTGEERPWFSEVAVGDADKTVTANRS